MLYVKPLHTVAAISSIYVLNDNFPILSVLHERDSDGDSTWLCHCARSKCSKDELVLVSLRKMLEHDPSLAEIMNLPPNSFALRNYAGDKWVYSTDPVRTPRLRSVPKSLTSISKTRKPLERITPDLY